MSDEQFAESALGNRSLADKRQLQGGVRYVAGGYDDPETYKRLAETLDALLNRSPSISPPLEPGRD